MQFEAEENMKSIPKLCGADIELGNFITGTDRFGSTCWEASTALLREIDGICRQEFAGAGSLSHSYYQPQARSGFPDGESYGGGYGESYTSNSQDWGRKFLPSNGGCAYIDLNHLELCIPEVISAYDHVACWNAMLLIAAKALKSANRKLRGGLKIQVLVNNSDGLGHSYGSHLNFLVAREAWDNIFSRKLHHMLFLAAYQASSIIFTGQGKVGSENGVPHTRFQISQRADFFEQLMGAQTTSDRPIVNSRDESLCGQASRDMARLHVIFFDNTLCPVSSLLKVGVTQIILSMMERGRVKPELLLDDPLQAVVTWSHDPTLRTKARMASGKYLTAVELQLLFLEEARRFLETDECSNSVPRANEIVNLWADTLEKLRSWDVQVLARRLDWVLKQMFLQRAMEQHPQLDWRSPQLKHLDLLYSSLDPEEGLFWSYANQNGLVEQVVDEQRINWFVHNPPEDTRAWARAMILRRASSDQTDRVDWDSIRIKTRGRGGWSRFAQLDMANPFAFTKATSEQVFQDGLPLDEILEKLAMLQDKDDVGEERPGARDDGSDSKAAVLYRRDLTGRNYGN
jgi:proteasome accessory factor A